MASVPLGLLYSVLLARSLGPDTRGEYAVFVTAVGILSGILSLGIGIVGRAEIASEPSRARQIHSNMVWFVIAAGLGLLALSQVFPSAIKAAHPFNRAIALVICAVTAIYAGFGTLVLQGLGHFRFVNSLRLLRSIFDIVCLSAIVVVLKLGLGGAVWSWTLSGSLAAISMFVLIARVIGLPVKGSLSGIRSAFRHGWKLLVAAQAIALETSLVILLLNRYGSHSDVGVFAIAMGLSFQVSSLCATLAVVASDRIAGPQRAASEELVKRLARLMFALVVPVTLAAMILSHTFVTLLYGAAYAAAAKLFVILLVGALLGTVTEVHAQYLIGQHWKSRDMMLLNLVNFAVALALSFALIPRYGAIGAAISLSGASALNAFMHHFWVRRIMGCPPHELLVLKRSDLFMMLHAFDIAPEKQALES